MTPTAEQLTAWRQLADAATLQEWEAKKVWPYDDYQITIIESPTGPIVDPDSIVAFVNASPEAVPMLLDEVKRLRAERDTLSYYAEYVRLSLGTGVEILPFERWQTGEVPGQARRHNVPATESELRQQWQDATALPALPPEPS